MCLRNISIITIPRWLLRLFHPSAARAAVNGRTISPPLRLPLDKVVYFTDLGAQVVCLIGTPATCGGNPAKYWLNRGGVCQPQFDKAKGFSLCTFCGGIIHRH